MIISKVKDLLPRETLELLRRRAGYSRAEMSKKLQVCENTVYNWESGSTRINQKAFKFSDITVIKLADHEICFILRNRKNLTQAQVAKKLKLSRYWVNLMEQGKKDCSRMLMYLKELHE